MQRQVGQRHVPWRAWIWLPLCLTQCFVPMSTGVVMQDNINALQVSTRTLRRDVDFLRTLEAEHTQKNLEKLAELSQALQEFNQSSHSTNADFAGQMERMIHDVQELRGTVEVNEHRLGETEQTMAQQLDALAKQHSASNNETSLEADNNLPKDKKAALSYALKLERDGKVNDARAAYRGILKAYPRELGVSDEAYFRLANSYFDAKRFDAALREYIHLIENFGKSGLVAETYYKIALCSLQLNRPEDAQTFLNEVINNYRTSTVFKLAKQKLDELSRRPNKDDKTKRPRKPLPAPNKRP